MKAQKGRERERARKRRDGDENPSVQATISKLCVLSPRAVGTQRALCPSSRGSWDRGRRKNARCPAERLSVAAMKKGSVWSHS